MKKYFSIKREIDREIDIERKIMRESVLGVRQKSHIDDMGVIIVTEMVSGGILGYIKNPAS